MEMDSNSSPQHIPHDLSRCSCAGHRATMLIETYQLSLGQCEKSDPNRLERCRATRIGGICLIEPLASQASRRVSEVPAIVDKVSRCPGSSGVTTTILRKTASMSSPVTFNSMCERHSHCRRDTRLNVPIRGPTFSPKGLRLCGTLYELVTLYSWPMRSGSWGFSTKRFRIPESAFSSPHSACRRR